MPAGPAKTKTAEAKGTVADDKARLVSQLVKENAVIPDAKLLNYALNMEGTADGKNKAIAFQEALGYNKNNAEQLKEAILNGLDGADKNYRESTEYGDKFSALIEITGPNGKTARVQTGWILRPGERKFSLTSVYTKRRKGK
jgi:hypothetical protein